MCCLLFQHNIHLLPEIHYHNTFFFVKLTISFLQTVPNLSINTDCKISHNAFGMRTIKSGFPLCPITSQVLCMRNKKHIYSVHSDSKCQITTPVAANAAGSMIPPMHIFPGKRSSYNAMEGAVAGAYMGEAIMDGWSHNFFMGGSQITVSHIPPEHPVLLIVGGYTTHIDVKISKFCRRMGSCCIVYFLTPRISPSPWMLGFSRH